MQIFNEMDSIMKRKLDMVVMWQKHIPKIIDLSRLNNLEIEAAGIKGINVHACIIYNLYFQVM